MAEPPSSPETHFGAGAFGEAHSGRLHLRRDPSAWADSHAVAPVASELLRRSDNEPVPQLLSCVRNTAKRRAQNRRQSKLSPPVRREATRCRHSRPAWTRLIL